METSFQSHRCPKCDALVVDRRSPVCTTCRAELPKEWVMSAQQIAKVAKIDSDARAEYNSAMTELDKVRSSSELPRL